MPAKRLEITLPEETWERLEEARGHEPRASFVKRALESALGNSSMGVPDSRDPGLRRETADLPASSRASKHNIRPVDLPGVKTARELAMERQRKLNERKP